MNKYLLFFILLFIVLEGYSQACDPSTPSFTFDLTGQPNGSWTSPQVRRSGLCCGLDPNASPPIRCVEFFFTLDEGAQGIRFEIASGAVPPGSLGYQIGCGEYKMVGEDICLDGPGPHRLTFCKPGNNPNTYRIVSIPKPKVSPPVTVSDGCTAMLTVSGLENSSIVWTSIPSDPDLEKYLSCTLGCDTVYGEWQPGAPAYVDYVVTGSPKGGCVGSVFTDTSRIYFVNDKKAEILPKDPVICYGGTAATLTAYGTGGAPPYTYLWSTGETTQSISVNSPGVYSVSIQDSTSCPAADTLVTVTQYLSPTRADAGPDVTSCANNPDVTLNGSVQSALGGIWSGGSGTYSPSETDLIATYTPTAAEIANGSVQHILTTTGTGDCPPHSDTTMMTITPAPTVDAGPDLTTCANNAQAQLNGSVTIASGGVWSGGGGSFTPGPTALNAVYIPTAAEIATGSVTLTLTTTGNGQCLPVTDQLVITITPAPTADAGPDQTVCGNNSLVQLNGSVTVASGGEWTGGTGTFSPGRNALNPTYSPSATEISNGSVTLTLTTTGNGDCLPVSDQILITITPAPTVSAGPDLGVCSNNPNNIQLAGSVTVATGGTWTGGNGTFSPGRTSLNPVYTPTAAEIAAGSVTFTLTTTGNGTCLPVSDQALLSFSPPPTVDAGPDSDVCANNATINLSGTVTGASGGTWTGGGGNFTPGRNSLTPSYTPTEAEISAGTITFTLTTTGNGSCLPVSDQVTYQITPAPTVEAGSDQGLCGATVTSLSGNVSIATGGNWTGGNGTFNPGRNNLNTNYTPTPQEAYTGSVTLTLTTTGNGKCVPVSDAITLTYKSELPEADAGGDQEICGTAKSVALNGTVTNTSGGIWSTSGSGTFDPSATALDANYLPSTADTAAGSIILTLTTTGSAPCPEVSDDANITFTEIPFVEAGPDQTICANSQTEIQFAASGNPGRWTGGNGTYSPNDSTLNAKYKPTSGEIGTTVKFVITTISNTACPSVKDSLNVTILPGPEVQAINDFTVCADTAYISLSSTLTNATQVQWTSTGNGTFSNPVNTTTDYTPTPEDTASGKIIFTVTTTDNGLCNAVSDEIEVIITPTPLVIAGPDQTVCAGASEVILNSSVYHASNVQWSNTGTGTFSPDNQRLDPRYQITPADTVAGTVSFVVETVDNGFCKPDYDTVLINFAPEPIALAGGPFTVCENNSTVSLNGAVYNTSSGYWSSLGSGTLTSTGLSPTYQPSLSDITSGTVNLVLTANPNQYCPAKTDTALLTITPAPKVNAGPDQTICSVDDVQLAGSVTVTGTGVWTGNGTFAPSDSDLNAVYTPTDAEKAAGVATIMLTSTNNGTCLPVSDEVQVTILPTPQASAGPDINICREDETVELAGSLNLASGGQWTTSGSGVFSPSANTENATYTLSAFDQTLSDLRFIYTAFGNGDCPAINDTMFVTFSEMPEVDAGAGSACADLSGVSVSAAFSNSSGLSWATTGTGSFSPDNTNPDITYNPSPQDLTNETLTLSVTTNPNGDCPAVSDTVRVTFTPIPTADAGPDITVCADTSYVEVSGSATNYNSIKWSSGSLGGFNPASNSLSTSYILTGADKTNGGATLILSVQGHPLCDPVTDTLEIEVTPGPTVNIGGDTTVCPSLGGILPLKAKTTVASGGIWNTTGTGEFFPSNSTANSYYQFTQEDYLNGNITFNYTTTGNGSCKPVSKIKHVQVKPVPTVEAGIGQTICRDAEAVAYSGSVEIATGLEWSTNGTGSFYPNAQTPVVYYRPSEADKGKNSVMLYLKSTGDFCQAALDSVKLSFVDAPIAYAGPDITICAQNPEIDLDGTITNAPGGYWTSDGTGVFLPNNQNLKNRYVFSVQDTIAKEIGLALTTVGVDACFPEDSVKVTLYPAPLNTFHDLPACEGEEVKITAVPSQFSNIPRSPIEWKKDNELMADTTTQLFVKNPGSYSVNFSVGDCHVFDTTTVTFHPSPTPEMQRNYLYCKERDGQQVLDAGEAHSYLWTLTEETTRKVIATDPGYYPVIIYNEYNCFAVDSVYLKDACPPRIYPTNAFSPNGDGVNDYFKIPGAYHAGFNITIFNRWGEIIYYSEESEPGWDGYYKGKLMEEGVYPWIIQYHASDEEYYEGVKTLSGSVTLIR